MYARINDHPCMAYIATSHRNCEGNHSTYAGEAQPMHPIFALVSIAMIYASYAFLTCNMYSAIGWRMFYVFNRYPGVEMHQLNLGLTNDIFQYSNHRFAAMQTKVHKSER